MRLLKIVSFCLCLPAAALAADSLAGAKTQVRTGAKTDVQAQITDGVGGANLLSVLANNSTPGFGAQELIGFAQTAAPSYTSGDVAMPWLDLSGQLHVVANGTAGAPNIHQLSDGAATYTAVKTGQVPSALGQTTMSGSLAVAIASNQSSIPVTFGAPSGIGFNRAASVNIASAGTSAIVCKSGLAVSQPTRPYQFVISSAALARCDLRFNDNGTFTTFSSVVTSAAAPTVTWTPPTPIGLTTSSTVTTLQYEANCTNFDTAAQDVACSIIYCQSAAGC